MEDLLLSNVHEMKIEIWDERLQKYTTPGHSEMYRAPSGYWPGDYSVRRSYSDSANYGPEGQSIGVFDTWHPAASAGGATHPPHIPYRYAPPKEDQKPPRTGPSPKTVPLNEPDRLTGNADNGGYWSDSGFFNPDSKEQRPDYKVGDVVFAPWVDTNGDNKFEYSEMPPQAFQVAYRCVFRDPSLPHVAPPAFPQYPGRRVREVNGAAEWESFDNRRPLSSLRMTLRFMDQTTNTQRTLTLILSLTDKE
jgi:hypothetical protein